MIGSTRSRTRSLVTAVATAALIAGVTAAPAAATPPSHGVFEESNTFVDAEYCADWGFAFDVVHHESGDFAIYTDTSGNFIKAIVHVDVSYTLTANGRSLIERDRLTEIYTPDGHREIGLWAHIQGDHAGLVLRDAGQLAFDSDGNLVRAPGQHPQYFGETFCAELAGTP
jgi:hypothetical protein